MRHFIFSLILLPLLLVTLPALADNSAQAILNEAKAVFKQADELQGAWVTTEKLIKGAEEALKKGDTKAAMQLATKAKVEADMSLAQAKEQQKNWAEPPYIR